MSTSLRIAVADDEPDVREYLRKVLLRLGHDVVGTVANGRELIALALESLPDLIITDIKMPDVEGIDAVQEILKVRPVPVILLSALRDGAWKERALADPALNYLVKPIKQADLALSIAGAMHRFTELQARPGDASPST